MVVYLERQICTRFSPVTIPLEIISALLSLFLIPTNDREQGFVLGAECDEFAGVCVCVLVCVMVCSLVLPTMYICASGKYVIII